MSPETMLVKYQDMTFPVSRFPILSVRYRQLSKVLRREFCLNYCYRNKFDTFETSFLLSKEVDLYRIYSLFISKSEKAAQLNLRHIKGNLFNRQYHVITTTIWRPIFFEQVALNLTLTIIVVCFCRKFKTRKIQEELIDIYRAIPK